MISSHIYWRINEAEEWTSSGYYYIGKLNEFGIPPVRGSLLVCNLEESEVRSREIRPPLSLEKALEFLRGCEHTTVSKLGWRNSVVSVLDQFYLFIFFLFFFSSSSSSLSARIESSLHSRTRGQSCSNFVTTMETTPRFENVAQICLLLLPSSFPYNLRR